MRKFFRGLFVLAVLAVGMSTVFTSCKDTDDDYHDEVNKQMVDISNQLNAIRDAQAACKQMCAVKDSLLNVAIGQLNVALNAKADTATVNRLRERVELLAAEAAQAKAAVDALTKQVNSLDSIWRKDISDSINELRNLLAGQVIESTKDVADQLVGQKVDSVTTIIRDEITIMIDSIMGTLTPGGSCGVNCDSLKTAFLTFERQMNTFKSTTNAAISKLNTAVDSLSLMLKDYSTVKKNANDALTQAGKNKAALELLEQKVDSIIKHYDTRDKYFAGRDRIVADSLRTLDQKIKDHIVEYNKLKDKLTGVEGDILKLYGLTDSLSEVTDSIFGSIAGINSTIAGINTDLADLSSRLGTAELTIIQHTQDIQDLNERVDNLFSYVNARLDNMITSLTLEGTYNPVFGAVSSPFGVNSNILMAYYGQAARGDVKFPSTSTSTEYCDLDEPILTGADMAILNAERELYGGTLVQGMDKDGNVKGNAGTVYFRVNPGTVDMTDKVFSLVDTRDEESGIKLDNVKKSDVQLRFGATFGRSAATNGFYSADATLTPNAVWSTKVEIEPGLKSSFGNVLKDIRNRKVDPSDLFELVKKLYDQFNGILPANAIKAEWTYFDSNFAPVQTAVYSPSQLAGTCFKPLGFNFLQGRSFRHIREFDPITEFDIFNPEDFTIDIKLDSIKLKEVNISISLDTVKISDAGKITVTGDVRSTIPPYEIIGHIENVEVDTKEFLAEIEKAINGSIDGWNESITNDLKTQIEAIQDDIQEQVNRLLADINGQISDQLSDLISKINNKFKDKTGGYFDRINGFINKYNSLAKRINRVLDDPNHYLQPIMVYKGSDGGFHLLSGNINRPSKFTLKGGNSIYLYPTTRNGEIVAPVFKKFVGVTNVWKTGDMAQSAQNGNAAAKALADKANANKSANMNKVFDGQELHVALEVPSSAKGYTYEIVYQALDYHGLTSTVKCYVTVE